jgi:hypothetical protein
VPVNCLAKICKLRALFEKEEKKMTDTGDCDARAFVLHFNPVRTNDPCGCCGRQTLPPEGYEIFLWDRSRRLVCESCLLKYAPELRQARVL